MKGEFRQGNLGEDPKSAYYEKKKYPEPTICSRCNLVYQKGRWSVEEAPSMNGKVHQALCPACHRIQDIGVSALQSLLSAEG